MMQNMRLIAAVVVTVVLLLSVVVGIIFLGGVEESEPTPVKEDAPALVRYDRDEERERPGGREQEEAGRRALAQRRVAVTMQALKGADSFSARRALAERTAIDDASIETWLEEFSKPENRDIRFFIATALAEKPAVGDPEVRACADFCSLYADDQNDPGMLSDEELRRLMRHGKAAFGAILVGLAYREESVRAFSIRLAAESVPALVAALEKREPAIWEQRSGILESARECLSEMLRAGGEWQGKPDAIEQMFASGEPLLTRLRRLGAGAAESDLLALLQSMSATRGGQLEQAATKARKPEELVTRLCSTERCFIYEHVPATDVVRELLHYYSFTGRPNILALRARTASLSNRYADAPSDLSSITDYMREVYFDDALRAKITSMRATKGRREPSFWANALVEGWLAPRLGVMSPGAGFVRMLLEGDADGYLEVGRQFVEMGELRAAARSFEKAVLGDSDKREAFRLLAAAYGAMGDDEGGKRTLLRASRLGIYLDPASCRIDLPEKTWTNGRLVWAVPGPPRDMYTSGVLADGTYVEPCTERTFAADMAVLRGIDVQNGKVLWSVDGPGRELGMTSGNVGRTGSSTSHISCANGKCIWDVALSWYTGSSGSAYAKKRYRIDPRSGRIVDTQMISLPAVVRLRPVADGNVAIGARGMFLHGIDLTQPKCLWKVDMFPGTGTHVNAHIFFAIDDREVAAGSDYGWVKLIDGLSGNEKWEGRLPAMVYCDPAFGEDKVFFGTVDGGLWALNRTTGEVAWEKQVPLWTTAMTCEHDRLYVHCNGGRLLCLDVSDGNTIWEKSLGNAVNCSMLAARQDVLYVLPGSTYGCEYPTSYRPTVYALDASSRNCLWAATLRESLAMSPIFLDGKVILPLRSETLCIDTRPDAFASRSGAALERVRHLEKAGRLRIAALMAAEALDSIDPGDLRLKAECARLACRADLGPFALLRMEEHTAVQPNPQPEVADLYREYLSRRLHMGEKTDRVLAAVLLERLGYWDDVAKQAVVENITDVRIDYPLKRLAYGAWARHAVPGEVEAVLESDDELRLVGLVHRNMGRSECLPHLRAGKREYGARAIRVAGGVPGGEPQPANEGEPKPLPEVSQYIMREVVVPTGGAVAKEMYLQNVPGSDPICAATLAHHGVTGLKAALKRKVDEGGTQAYTAAYALAALHAQEYQDHFLKNLDKVPCGFLASMRAEHLATELEEIAMSGTDTRSRAAFTELALLLGENTAPSLVRIHDAHPERVADAKWRSTMLYAVRRIGTAELMPIFQDCGIRTGYASYDAEYLREYATKDSLLPYLNSLLGQKSSNRITNLATLALVLGDELPAQARNILRDETADTQVVVGALDAIGLAGNETDVPRLVTIARSHTTPAEVRLAAVSAIAAIAGDAGKEGLQALRAMQENDTTSVQCRELATIGLAIVGDNSAVLDAGMIHLEGHEPAKKQAWEVFAYCYARETDRRIGSTYVPSWAGEPGNEGFARKWLFYFRDMTQPQERLTPFPLAPEEEAPDERPRDGVAWDEEEMLF